METNTYQRISTITPARIRARMDVADKRVKVAAVNMTDRYYRRAENINVPIDMAPLPLPNMPPVPMEILIISISRNSVNYWSRSGQRDQFNNAINRNSIDCKIADNAGPVSLVAAIVAADNYATEFELAAREYERATAIAISDHVLSQIDAVRTLTSLCGQYD